MIYIPSFSSMGRNARYSDEESHPKFPSHTRDDQHRHRISSTANTNNILVGPTSSNRLSDQVNQRKTYYQNIRRLYSNDLQDPTKTDVKLVMENLTANNNLTGIEVSKLWQRRDSCGCPLPSQGRSQENSLIQSAEATNHIKSPHYPDVYFDGDDTSHSENSTRKRSSQRIILKRSNSRHLLKKKSTVLFKKIETLKRRRNLSQASQNKLTEHVDTRLGNANKFSRENALSFRPQLLPDEESDCDATDRITLNVSGMRFETWIDILQQHPTTLLGNPKKIAKYYDETTSEYFFDRHRPTFEAIFNYYQYGGRIKRPHNIPDDIFLDELDFYEIEPEIIAMYKKSEGYIFDTVILPENRIKRIIWQLFEIPDSSKLAYFFAIISVLFTIISIISFCLETLPANSNTHCDEEKGPNFNDKFFIMESVCTFWFTVEVIARFFSCPSKRQYMLDPRNYVDIVAIFPYYLTLIQVLYNFSCQGARNSASLAFLRVIRLVRVFKLTKHSAGLQVLILTFKESIEGLSLFLVALIVCIVVFSSAIYYAEQGVENSNIGSIPDAFWWAVITMCTVGYGDKHPEGPWGKLIGSICAVAGVLTLAIPVPIITENFNKFYSHKKSIRRP